MFLRPVAPTKSKNEFLNTRNTTAIPTKIAEAFLRASNLVLEDTSLLNTCESPKVASKGIHNSKIT